MKGLRLLIMIFLLSFAVASFAQFEETDKEFDPLYRTEDVIRHLSYENFKRIKLLHSAIMNYGGGKSEFDQLVDEYAEASALYFQNKKVESANLFTKNKKTIDDISMAIAKKYNDDTTKLHTSIIKMHVKYKVKMSINGEKENPQADVALSQASYGLQKANDFFVRSKAVDAIFYYRRAKDSCFQLYKVLEVPLPQEFNKDMIDNKNQVYVSKEKNV